MSALDDGIADGAVPALERTVQRFERAGGQIENTVAVVGAASGSGVDMRARCVCFDFVRLNTTGGSDIVWVVKWLVYQCVGMSQEAQAEQQPSR